MSCVEIMVAPIICAIMYRMFYSALRKFEGNKLSKCNFYESCISFDFESFTIIRKLLKYKYVIKPYKIFWYRAVPKDEIQTRNIRNKKRWKEIKEQLLKKEEESNEKASQDDIPENEKKKT